MENKIVRKGDVIRRGTIAKVIKEAPGAAVGELVWIQQVSQRRYSGAFLDKDRIGSGYTFYKNELKRASPTDQKRYNKKVRIELFGTCYSKGCSDTCSHNN